MADTQKVKVLMGNILKSNRTLEALRRITYFVQLARVLLDAHTHGDWLRMLKS